MGSADRGVCVPHALTFTQTSLPASASQPYVALAADLDGDGYDDLVEAYPDSPDRLEFLRGSASGLGAAQAVVLDATEMFSTPLAAGAFEGGATKQVAAQLADAGIVLVGFQGAGAPAILTAFAAPEGSSDAFAAGNFSNGAIALADDVDRDGMLYVEVPSAGATSWLDGGVFNADPNDMLAIAAADLSGPSADVLALSDDGSKIEIFRNADGGLTAPTWIASGLAAIQTPFGGIASANFDGAGRVGAAYFVDDDSVNDVPGQAGILRSLGAAPLVLPFDGGYDAVATGDFDGDCRDDVLVGVDDQVWLYLALDDGGFAQGRLVGAANGNSPINSITAGDFNGDGMLDIAVASQSTSTDVFMATAPTLACPPGAWACDNFDTGSALGSAWVVDVPDGGSIDVADGGANDGAYSMHVHVPANGGQYTQGFAAYNFPGQPTYPLFIRAAIKPSASALINGADFIYVYPSSYGDVSLDVGQASVVELGRQSLADGGVAPSVDSASAHYTADTWQCVEWEIDAAAPFQAGGGERLWLNGAAVSDLTVDGVSLDLPGEFLFGWDGDPTADVDVYFDDVAISQLRLGCP